MDERWEDAEDVDFHVQTAASSDGTVWLWLVCSQHGNLQATRDGVSTDLGFLSTAAQLHYEEKHLPENVGAPVHYVHDGDSGGGGEARK